MKLRPFRFGMVGAVPKAPYRALYREELLPSLGVLPKVPKVILITASTTNVNLFTLAGSPNYLVNIVFKVLAGVVIGSTISTAGAITTGSFVAGSKITLINFGSIMGQGGGGGAGAAGNNPGIAGLPGNDGGAALSLACNLIWMNFGTLTGGGGGGGGGSSSWNINDNVGGGGGGGGQGFTTSLGGAAGATSGPNITRAAAAGTNGNQAGPGTGSLGGASNIGQVGGTGGNGGAFGTAGVVGGNGSPNVTSPVGGNPGAAGKAIALNGFTLTTYVNNGTYVGAVA